MESEAKYAVVGLVVVLLTLAVIAAILWLSDDGLSKDADEYVVYFEKQSLSGLQVDGWVTMRGIKVGSVESVAISKDNIEQLEVILSLDATTPVKTDSKAVIRRNLLTGLAWVDLTESTQEAQLLKTIDRKSPLGLPIIPEGQTELEAIADSIPRLIEEIGQVAQRANTFLSEDNRESVTNTLKNIEAFSNTLAKNDKAITELVSNLSEMSVELSKLSKSWTTVGNSAENDLNKVTAEVELTLKDLRDAINRVDDEVVVIAKALRNTADVFAAEATTISKSIDEAARSIARVADQFEDPKGAIFGPNRNTLGPGESRLR
ncbi:MAG: MCE family protein [Bdellovibrionales bacterium]|nr:MCE family protein [Bdellovibrionales bacterium]